MSANGGPPTAPTTPTRVSDTIPAMKGLWSAPEGACGPFIALQHPIVFGQTEPDWHPGDIETRGK